MLIEIFKEALRLMKKNLNLAQLIFIFFIVITIFTPVLASVKINIKIIPMVVIFYALICAFFAGLFFAFKKSVDYETNPPKTNDPFDLPPLYFAEFFQGVGKYFTKYLLAGLVLIILLVLVALGYDYIIGHYVIIPHKLLNVAHSGILSSNARMIEFMNSLTPDDVNKLFKLSLLTFGAIGFYGFITMLYPISLVEEEKNFFKSFLISVKNLFKNFPVSLVIFIFFNIILFLVGIVSASSVNNIFISVIAILLQCYLNVWYILTLLVYYEKVK